MSRNPQLEALLQAKFDLDHCAHEERGGFLWRFHDLLEQALARKALPELTSHQLEELLREPYRQFRRAKLLEQRARLSRCDKMGFSAKIWRKSRENRFSGFWPLTPARGLFKLINLR